MKHIFLRSIYIYLLVLLFGFLNIECSTRLRIDNNNIDKTESSSQTNITSEHDYLCEEDGLVGPVSELTYDKFLNIYNSNDQFFEIMIDYADYRNFDITGEPCDRRQLSISCGDVFASRYLNSVIDYRSILDVSSWCPEPGYDKLGRKTFQANLLDDLYSYIMQLENRTYFFNGEEHQGQNQPYWASSFFLHEDNYMFALSIGDPASQSSHLWMISKSTDSPDEIWRGLISILESNFISQFED